MVFSISTSRRKYTQLRTIVFVTERGIVLSGHDEVTIFRDFRDFSFSFVIEY